MVYNEYNHSNRPPMIKKDWNQWKQGLQNLYDLGCRFTAVYGSEPLTDMEYLPEYFKECQRLGMYHTLITNCSVAHTKDKLRELVDAGLHSLTVSFDGNEDELSDKSSSVKSGKGLETARWFKKEFGDKVRDVAVVFTLTKTNLFSILNWIPKLADEGIYVFFDLIHNDYGNPDSKCRNYDGIEELLFTNEDEQKLKLFGEGLWEIKQDEKLRPFIHQSDSFIDVLRNAPELYIQKMWNCATDEYKKVFPTWLTIDYDGTARVCDDFHIRDGKNWKFWELDNDETFTEFKDYWFKTTQRECKGCFWNTHFDSNLIKLGKETFENYINNELEM